MPPFTVTVYGSSVITVRLSAESSEEESEEEEDEVVIFALKGEGEDAMLEPIDDEDVLDGVFEEFCRQYEEYEEEYADEE